MVEQDPFDFEAKERAARERARSAKQAAAQEAEDFKLLMRSKWGRRIVWREMESSGMFLTSSALDLATLARDAGLRSAGLRWLAMVHEHTPELYPVMVKEQKELNARRNTNSSDGRGSGDGDPDDQ